MEAVANKSPWGFLLRPWRYDFEYARAWRELNFPLYGVVHPQPAMLRMGGKGRGGVVPPRPINCLPPGIWTKLTHLQIIVEGSNWEIKVDNSMSHLDIPPTLLDHTCRHHAKHGRYATGTGQGSPTTASHELLVDGMPIRFNGYSLDGIWVGAARTPRTMIKLVTSNTRPDEIALAQITDPGPYLQGQRKFMRS